ncbi:hypothetical protein Tco_1354965 [Tanacetum coccineum]
MVMSYVGLYMALVNRDTVMSDFKDSTVTYTAMSSPFANLPDIGPPGVDGPPVMPEDPYAYVHVYPEFMPLEDEILPTEEQPLPADVSPTADSPGYVLESDPEEDPEEDDDEDPEEDPVDYPADVGDDGDDEDESSDDDVDKDVDIEEGALSAEETESFKTDESAATPPPHPAYRVTARISIIEETPISLPPREEVERLLAMPTPLSLPLFLWSSPLP